MIICFKDSPRARQMVTDLVLGSIEKVNEEYLLRRNLGADVQYGKRYSQIH